MRSLHVNGYDMPYAEHGSGTPLLLIHGTLLDQRYWAPQMETLGRLVEPGGSLGETLAPAHGASGAPAPPVTPFAEAVAGAAQRVREGDIDGGLGLFVEAVMGPGAWERSAERIRRMQRDNARTLLGQVNEGRRPYTRADMAAIRAPTLLVGGADTPLLFPPILDAMECGIAGAERVDLPGTTHLMSDEDPAAFNAAVLGFLGGRT
jgi:esterase